MPVEGAATAEGMLERTPLAHLLVYAADKRLTGAMVFHEPGGAEHVVQLSKGAAVKVRPGDQYAMFGEILVEDGLVSRETLDAALATRGLIGDVLLLSGCIDAVTLEWVAEVQFVRRMVRLFALPPGTTYRYFDGESSLEEWGGEPARVDPLALLWAGLRDHGSRSTRLEPTLARLGNAPLRLHEALDPERFGFRSAELAAVGRMREAAPTLPALLGAGIAPEQELRHLVYTLLITRYVDLGGSNALPVGIARSGRAPMPSASMLGRLQLRSTMHRLGAAAPDPSGDGERPPVSMRSRSRDRISSAGGPGSGHGGPEVPASGAEPRSSELSPPSSARRPVGSPSLESASVPAASASVPASASASVPASAVPASLSAPESASVPASSESASVPASEPASTSRSPVAPGGEPWSDPGDGLASPLTKP